VATRHAASVGEILHSAPQRPRKEKRTRRRAADSFARFEKTRGRLFTRTGCASVWRPFVTRQVGVGFALSSARAIVIRAIFFLTLALTVATGESATLICQAVCDRGTEADADACHHAQSAAPVLTTDDTDCLSISLSAMATPRVELNRPDSHGAAPVAVSNELPMTTCGPAFASKASFLRVGGPPRTIALRI
jgi:hypothetical protein